MIAPQFFVNLDCPNINCKKADLVKAGKFYRKCDSKWVQRFRCKSCGKYLCSTTNTLEYKFKVRRKISMIRHLYCSNMSLRRISMVLDLNYKTVVRKVEYLGVKARIQNQKFIRALEKRPIKVLQFDDLITIEHTKLKPLSVTLAVNPSTRKIIDVQVSKIPAFGLLAEKSRKIYGYRQSNHRENLEIFFRKLTRCVSPDVYARSDKHKLYPIFMNKYFPHADYQTFESKRSSVAGQGELKKTKYDPIFYINHTFAMCRANINRLIRKTWCTTKRVDRLKEHLEIYQAYHNEKLV